MWRQVHVWRDNKYISDDDDKYNLPPLAACKTVIRCLADSGFGYIYTTSLEHTDCKKSVTSFDTASGIVNSQQSIYEEVTATSVNSLCYCADSQW